MSSFFFPLVKEVFDHPSFQLLNMSSPSAHWWQHGVEWMGYNSSLSERTAGENSKRIQKVLTLIHLIFLSINLMNGNHTTKSWKSQPPPPHPWSQRPMDVDRLRLSPDERNQIIDQGVCTVEALAINTWHAQWNPFHWSDHSSFYLADSFTVAI